MMPERLENGRQGVKDLLRALGICVKLAGTYYFWNQE
jgi:hypothetical protein